MPRSALWVLAAAALVGCRPAADAEPVGVPEGPGAGVAGTEIEGSPAKPATPDAVEDDGGDEGGSEPVAVTKRDQAGPCERVCGSLGDCLLADEGYSSAVAGRLELECLDRCVYAPDDHASKRELLGCNGQACPELAACAERNWAALEAASQALDLRVEVVDSDPCMASCRSLWSCLASGQPLGVVEPDPDGQQEAACVLTCESPAERDLIQKVWACVRDRDQCSDPDAIYACWTSAMTH